MGAHSEGEESYAQGRGSHAEGGSTTASGSNSHTEGTSTYAGYSSHAEGYNTIAGGTSSNPVWFKLNDLESCPLNKGSAVIYNNNIHILGGIKGDSAIRTQHWSYVKNTDSWTNVSTLPYDFTEGCAVTYNGEIHILGGSGHTTNHYKWNGSTWTKVSNLPYNFTFGCAVVYNSEIHILGGGTSSITRTNHYKWNGSTWTSVSTLPFNLYNSSAVVYNSEIHILGGNSSYLTRTNHYKWNGSAWTSVSTLPGLLMVGKTAEVHDSTIYILCHNKNNTSLYKWNNSSSSWRFINICPSRLENCYTISYNNEIHVLGGDPEYAYGSSTWSEAVGLPHWISTTKLKSFCHSEGSETIAAGLQAHAEGEYSQATVSNSHAIGYEGLTYDSKIFAIGGNKDTINDNIAKEETNALLADNSPSNVFSVDLYGNFFSTGAQSFAHGYLGGILATTENIPQIVLEDGAVYLLHVVGSTGTAGAFRGVQSYIIGTSFNEDSQIGIATTAAAVPHISSLGSTGTTPVKLITNTNEYTTSAGTVAYHAVLGIASCTSAVKLRWNLVKVMGSVNDFPCE